MVEKPEHAGAIPDAPADRSQFTLVRPVFQTIRLEPVESIVHGGSASAVLLRGTAVPDGVLVAPEPRAGSGN